MNAHLVESEIAIPITQALAENFCIRNGYG